MLDDPTVIAHRVVNMVNAGEVTATDGTVLRVAAESVCVHGDSPGAVQIAAAVHEQLPHRRGRDRIILLMRLKLGRPDLAQHAHRFNVPSAEQDSPLWVTWMGLPRYWSTTAPRP